MADVGEDLLLEPRQLGGELHVQRRQRRAGRSRRRWPPSGPGSGSGAAPSRRRAGPATALTSAAASGSRTASAARASSPARADSGRPAAAGGSTRSSRSATTSAIAWLRSEALRRYAAICVSKATGVGTAAGSSASRATSEGLRLVRDERHAGGLEGASKGIRGGRALRHDHPAVLARDAEPEGPPLARPRVVEDHRDADGRPSREPSGQGRHLLLADDLDAIRRGDEGGQRCPEVARRERGRGRARSRRQLRRSGRPSRSRARAAARRCRPDAARCDAPPGCRRRVARESASGRWPRPPAVGPGSRPGARRARQVRRRCRAAVAGGRSACGTRTRGRGAPLRRGRTRRSGRPRGPAPPAGPGGSSPARGWRRRDRGDRGACRGASPA